MARIWSNVERRTRKRLLLGLAAAVLLPALVDLIAHSFIQPGLHDNAAKLAQMIDFMTLGAIGFGLSAVATIMIGVLIVASMKGPGYVADVFEAGDPAKIHQYNDLK